MPSCEKEEKKSIVQKISETIQLWIWRVIMSILTPITCFYSNPTSWWTPICTKMVMISVILNVVFPWYDASSDFQSGNYQLTTGNPWFGIFTLTVPFLPFAVKTIIEIGAIVKILWICPALFKDQWKEL